MHLQLLSLQKAPNNSAMTSLMRILYLPGLVGELLWVYLRQDRLSHIRCCAASPHSLYLGNELAV